MTIDGKQIHRFISAIGVLFAASVVQLDVAWGATYYVDISGSNANAGTPTSPWATVQHAVTRVFPGDTILINPGTYQVNQTIYITRAGTSAQGISIRGNGGRVVLDGSTLDGLTYLSKNIITR